jgi:transcriptional regulator with XRE-family HTH domain
MDFSAYLKKLREKNKLSIRQLALYSDVSAGYLSQIESGARGIPSPEVIKKLHKPLKVEYEELMKAAGYLDEGYIDDSSPHNKEGLAFLGGPDESLSEDEKEHLRESLEQFRKLKAKFLANKNK